MPVSGPWGGGNKTVSALSKGLEKRGIEVTYDLNEDAIDVIMCIDPRPNQHGIWYQHFLNYKSQKPLVKIVQRVGDVGTHSKPELTSLVKQSVNFSDFVIFPSKWAKDYIHFEGKNYKIIPNRPLSSFFNFRENRPVGNKINVVTHHWSTNPKKGFDTYELLSNIDTSSISLTYIGRTPDNFNPKNIKIIPPQDTEFLTKELPLHDIYLTASIEEAGANHVLEAMAAGLPVLYHSQGGSIPEYCKDYGVSFSSNADVEDRFKELVLNFKTYKKSVMKYSETIDQTIRDYCEIIIGI
jgi:glycosyltransferase involved in cell wall biosynthesis